MKVSVFIGFFLAGWMAATVHAAEKPTDYAYGLTIEASGSEALYEVTLPAVVYEGVTRRDLGDVRVFNGAGEVVPHAWRPRRSEKAEAGARVPLTLFPLKAASGADLEGLSINVTRGANGKLGSVSVSVDGNSGSGKAGLETMAYLIDLSAQERALRAVELEWKPAEGFSGKLRVDASDDLASWRSLVSAAPLMNLEVSGQRLQQKRVELPHQRAKYLRLAWVREERVAAPEITSASGELAEKFVEATREWRKFSATKGEKENDYVFDLKGQIPIDRLRLDLPQANTIAQIEVLTRDKDDRPWRSVARGVAYRLNQDGGEVQSPDIPLVLTGERWLMVRVDRRGGGIGGGMPVLNAGWVPHQLVFAARGGPPFTLAYGNAANAPNPSNAGRRGAQADSSSGAIPIESLIPGYRDDGGANVRTAKTSAQRTVSVQTATSSAQKELGGQTRLQEQIDWKRWSLWGVLGLGVLALGGMAWRMVRQLGNKR